jgi:hypothetical protein
MSRAVACEEETRSMAEPELRPTVSTPIRVAADSAAVDERGPHQARRMVAALRAQAALTARFAQVETARGARRYTEAAAGAAWNGAPAGEVPIHRREP